MSNIKSWSKTPGSNNASPPNGWPEGMAPSSVNDTARQQMADHRTQWEDAAFFDWGHVPIQQSTKSFLVSSTATQIYTIGRALRFYDAGTQFYGWVKNSAASGANTLVSITGTAVSSSLSSIAIAIIDPQVTQVLTTPPGLIAPYAGSTAPVGWALCDGSSQVRTGKWAALFAVIGVTYGNLDGTHFNLPDLKGRAVFGVDNMGGSAASRVTSASGITGTTLGATGGDELMQGHTHTIPLDNFGAGAQNIAAAAGSTTLNQSDTSGSTGSGSSENMPPAIMLNYIIKL